MEKIKSNGTKKIHYLETKEINEWFSMIKDLSDYRYRIAIKMLIKTALLVEGNVKINEEVWEQANATLYYIQGRR